MQMQLPFYKKLDGIGRIVIPKEIRAFTGIRKGNEVKIVLQGNGDIVVTSNMPKERDCALIKTFLTTLSKQLNRDIIACDKDGAVVAVGKNDYILDDFKLSSETISFFHSESKAVSIGNAFENSQLSVSKAFSFYFRKTNYILVIVGGAPISEDAVNYISYTTALLKEFPQLDNIL